MVAGSVSVGSRKWGIILGGDREVKEVFLGGAECGGGEAVGRDRCVGFAELETRDTEREPSYWRSELRPPVRYY